jgi:hypothetical protein
VLREKEILFPEQEIFSSAFTIRVMGKEIIEIPKGIMFPAKEISIMGGNNLSDLSRQAYVKGNYLNFPGNKFNSIANAKQLILC